MRVNNHTTCCCGAAYEDFRAGNTYGQVHAMLSAGHDETFWQNRSNGAVLRLMAKLKRETWLTVHAGCEASAPSRKAWATRRAANPASGTTAARKAWETRRARIAVELAAVPF